MSRKRDYPKSFLQDPFGNRRSRQKTPTPSRSTTPAPDTPESSGMIDQERSQTATTTPLPSTANPPSVSSTLPGPNSQHSTSSACESINFDGWKKLKLFSKALDKTPEGFGPLKRAARVLVSFIDTFETTAENRIEFQALRTRLEGRFSDLQNYINKSESPAITASIKNLQNDIEKEAEYIERLQGRNGMSRYLQAEQDADRVLKCYQRIEGLFQRLTLNMNIDMWGAIDRLATEAFLDKLPKSPAAFYCSAESIKLNRGSCTENTRVDVLRELQEWADGASPERIYWLNGMAGTGKTTIAYSFCKQLEENQVLGASFFCSRQLPECRDVNRIVSTIAYQLCRVSLPFLHIISPLLKNNPDVYNKRIYDQFEQLIVEPVNKVKDAIPTNLVIVIDALDECDADTGVADILDILLAHAPGLPLRFFVSSRPDTNILDRMRLKQGEGINTEMRLHELGRTVVQTDIRTYLNARLNPRLSLSEANLSILVERSGVLFIYASTAVRYITADNFSRGTRRLKEVLATSGGPQGGNMTEIDKLYAAILETAFNDPTLTHSDQKEMQMVVHTVVCAQEPLSIEVMAGLLGFDATDSVIAALRPLFSVLQVSPAGVITTLHESFRDFLLDQSRSGQFYCDQAEHNTHISECCFNQISIPPQFNICGIQSSYFYDEHVPGLKEEIDRSISTTLFYACRYWGAHVALARERDSLAERLLEFFSQRLLLWIEIMNLKKGFADGIKLLHQFNKWSKVVTWIQGEIKKLAFDGWMFMNHCWSSPVLRSTPHIYMSALLFWSKESSIKSHYGLKESKMIRKHSTAMKMRKKLPVITMKTGKVTLCVAYSACGEYVAVGLVDGTVRIWDSYIGQETNEPLQGHTHWVTSVGYSPDGAYIVSGSRDKTVRIWSARTGEQVGQPLHGHTSSVTSVGYSPDGAYIVSGSDDKTVRIWSARTGEQVGQPLQGHTEEVTSVGYSPDGAYIVSGSHDNTVRIWSARTGEQVRQPLQGHTEEVTSVGYSPDGAYIVSGSWDNTARIWSARTGEQVGQPLHGHTKDVTSVGYSPDGAYIVSGSYDNTVRIWSARTGEQVGQPLQGHTEDVTSVGYSPDGAYIVSGSSDNTVRIWSARTGEQVRQPLHGHTKDVTSVGYSPDGAYIVSGSRDNTARIWSARTGEQVGQPLHGHTDFVTSVGYSPDGAYIVSGSWDNTVRFWSARTGEQVGQPLHGHAHWVTSVGYSPDGAYIVSGSWDKTVRIWSARTGEQVGQPLHGHTSLVTSVGYSPDGAYIVSGSWDNTVRFWSARTGEQVGQPLHGHAHWVTSVGYSPDGAYIVSGSRDKTVRIWSARTGEQVGQPLHGHTEDVTSVGYSPDGAYIVSGSRDKTVRIWSARTGEQIGQPLHGHTRWVASVGYSPDGAYIVSGSDDKTVRIWSARTGEQVGQPLHGHTKDVTSVGYSPDGAYIVSGSSDDTARVWHLRSDTSIEPLLTLVPPRTVSQIDQWNTLPPTGSTPHICASACDIDGSHRRWRVDDEGWVVLPSGELLVWVPPDLWTTLLWPENAAIASSLHGVLYLQPDPRFIGNNWADHFNPFKS
ncbi:Vegetative incompatibility protein HET-E-1 [Ceratobasidium sp. AG-Ba]|nr:Vegetative incompatibility protein HET-E-1 [Ceratobasidium sp. AG-Ba]